MLLSFCCQIALGMEYLSKKSFVHRDLAARNILVSAEKHCKVCLHQCISSLNNLHTILYYEDCRLWHVKRFRQWTLLQIYWRKGACQMDCSRGINWTSIHDKLEWDRGRVIRCTFYTENVGIIWNHYCNKVTNVFVSNRFHSCVIVISNVKKKRILNDVYEMMYFWLTEFLTNTNAKWCILTTYNWSCF